MKAKDMKRALKQFSRVVKNDLFEEVGFNQEELKLMRYLYIDKINQNWISDELGISMPTLNCWHNDCLSQIVSFFNYQKFKYENNEENCFNKYFRNL